jgi:hypothetical protein
MSKYEIGLLIALGISLIFFRGNTYVISAFLAVWSVITTYQGIKTIHNLKKTKKKVLNRISIYCKQEIDKDSFIYYGYIPIMIITDSIERVLGVDVIYIIKHFSKVALIEQLKLMIVILVVIITLLTILSKVYMMINFKEGIVYEEGLTLNDGKLYRFSDVKKYEFKNSPISYKYRNIVLIYKNNETKTVYINRDDIDKIDDLINK